MSTVTRFTADDLLVLPEGKDFELVGGELSQRKVSALSSYVANQLSARLTLYVNEHDLGAVFGSDAGYRCFSHEHDRVRRPDVSFVSRQRLPPEEIGDGWITIAPDLAVEVVSPRDVAAELREKLEDYAAAGIPAVWIVYPEARSAVVRRPDGTSRDLPRPVEFVGERELDGFRCPLADLLPRT